MIYSYGTRYEELMLVIKVRTFKTERINLVVYDKYKANTVFTNRHKMVNGDNNTGLFYVRMPISPDVVLIDIYNDRVGNKPKGVDDSFEVVSIEKRALEKKADVVDFNNPLLKSMIKFLRKFCYNAGVLDLASYVSDDGNYQIDYLDEIRDYKTNEVLRTPARISQETGRIELAKDKFVPLTVPGRMAVLLHEISHYYINDNFNNEVESDLNGLLIYLALGYPRIEALEVFRDIFAKSRSKENDERYEIMNKFITEFENNNYLFYE